MIIMADEFVIKIIPDGIDTSSGGSGGSTGGINTGGVGKMGKAFQGAIKALGIASLVGLVAKMVSSFSALLNVVGSIGKLISLIFKPIADALMILLMPLLYLMKPIVLALNELMRPFIKLSLDVMKQGAKMLQAGETQAGLEAFGGAAAIVISGLSTIIVALTSQLLKLFFTIATNSIGSLFGFSEETINNAVSNINTFIDDQAIIVSARLGGYAAAIGETFGVSIDQFRTDHRNAIENLFHGSEGIMDKYGIVFEDTRALLSKEIRDTMVDDPNSFMNTIDAVNKQLQAAASNAGKDLVDAFVESNKAAIARARASIKGKEVGTGGSVFEEFAGKTQLEVSMERAKNTIGVNPKKNSRAFSFLASRG